MLVHRLLTLSVLTSLSGLAPAQSGWTYRNLVSNPPADSPSMAYDSNRGVAVLLAFDSASGNDRTYEWNGTAWQLRSTVGPWNAPSVRLSAMVFDPVRNVTVLLTGSNSLYSVRPAGNFAGGNSACAEWDGVSWNVQASTGMPARCKHGMAYDAARGQIVVFGGMTEGNQGGAVHRDTWLRSGTSWFQAHPPVSPAARHGMAMAYDSQRQRVVMFGGTTRNLNTFASTWQTFQDTWEWDGNSWFEIQPQHVPPAREEAAVTYDPVTRRVILFGGADDHGAMLGDTWAWDGSDWHQLATSTAPARRYDAAMVCDELHGNLVLFGGTNWDQNTYLRDTWTLVPAPLGGYQTYGVGCAGSGGTPSLSAGYGMVPTAGQSFAVQVTGLPLVGSTFLFVGASQTQWGSFALPLNLSVIGMNGCSLLASGDFLLPVTNVLGSGLCSFDLPLSLAGQQFFNQAIALAPGANPAGMIVSNGARATVGQ